MSNIDHRFTNPSNSLYLGRGRSLSVRDMPTEQQLELLLANKSLRHFMRQAFNTVESGEYITGWHIDAICDHLEAVSRGEIKRLIINIPPRHCKSLTVSVFWPAWVWTWRPETKWIYGSHDQKLSTRDNLQMRRLIRSDWYQDRWPHIQLEKDQDAKMFYQNTLRGVRRATSVGSGITGEGGDILVCDDPHNALDALTSDANREKAIHWWTSTMSSRLNPGSPLRCKVIIMQRIHELDLAGYLLDKAQKLEEEVEGYSEAYDLLCLPARYEKKHPYVSNTKLNFKDPRTEEGEVLWEAGQPGHEIDALARELGTYSASGQLQQRPSPEGGGLIKTTFFIEVPEYDWPTRFDEVITSWDLAYEVEETNDWTAAFALGRKKNDIYLINRIKFKKRFIEQLEEVKKFKEAHPQAKTTLIEKAAQANALRDTLKDTVPGIRLVESRDNKIKKVLAWTPYLEAGHIHVPQGAIWLEDFYEEAKKFPTGAHDDQVDAAGQGILYLMHKAKLLTNLKVG